MNQIIRSIENNYKAKYDEGRAMLSTQEVTALLYQHNFGTYARLT